MSATHDFSRRFFADFIATRIKAWTMEEGAARPASRVHSKASEDDPARIETHAADPVDRPRSLFRGLGSSRA